MTLLLLQASLNKLMETLDQAEPYFVKCIRSNAEKVKVFCIRLKLFHNKAQITLKGNREELCIVLYGNLFHKYL